MEWASFGDGEELPSEVVEPTYHSSDEDHHEQEEDLEAWLQQQLYAQNANEVHSSRKYEDGSRVMYDDHVDVINEILDPAPMAHEAEARAEAHTVSRAQRAAEERVRTQRSERRRKEKQERATRLALERQLQRNAEIQHMKARKFKQNAAKQTEDERRRQQLRRQQKRRQKQMEREERERQMALQEEEEAIAAAEEEKRLAALRLAARRRSVEVEKQRKLQEVGTKSGQGQRKPTVSRKVDARQQAAYPHKISHNAYPQQHPQAAKVQREREDLEVAYAPPTPARKASMEAQKRVAQRRKIEGKRHAEQEEYNRKLQEDAELAKAEALDRRRRSRTAPIGPMGLADAKKERSKGRKKAPREKRGWLDYDAEGGDSAEEESLDDANAILHAGLPRYQGGGVPVPRRSRGGDDGSDHRRHRRRRRQVAQDDGASGDDGMSADEVQRGARNNEEGTIDSADSGAEEARRGVRRRRRRMTRERAETNPAGSVGAVDGERVRARQAENAGGGAGGEGALDTLQSRRLALEVQLEEEERKMKDLRAKLRMKRGVSAGRVRPATSRSRPSSARPCREIGRVEREDGRAEREGSVGCEGGAEGSADDGEGDTTVDVLDRARVVRARDGSRVGARKGKQRPRPHTAQAGGRRHGGGDMDTKVRPKQQPDALTAEEIGQPEMQREGGVEGCTPTRVELHNAAGAIQICWRRRQSGGDMRVEEEDVGMQADEMILHMSDESDEEADAQAELAAAELAELEAAELEAAELEAERVRKEKAAQRAAEQVHKEAERIAAQQVRKEAERLAAEHAQKEAEMQQRIETLEAEVESQRQRSAHDALQAVEQQDSPQEDSPKEAHGVEGKRTNRQHLRFEQKDERYEDDEDDDSSEGEDDALKQVREMMPGVRISSGKGLRRKGSAAKLRDTVQQHRADEGWQTQDGEQEMQQEIQQETQQETQQWHGHGSVDKPVPVYTKPSSGHAYMPTSAHFVHISEDESGGRGDSDAEQQPEYDDEEQQAPPPMTNTQQQGWLWRPSKCRLRLPLSEPRQWNGGYKAADPTERLAHPTASITVPQTPNFNSDNRLAKRKEKRRHDAKQEKRQLQEWRFGITQQRKEARRKCKLSVRAPSGVGTMAGMR
jgi:hypothetical protein